MPETNPALPRCPHCTGELGREFLSSEWKNLMAAIGKGLAGRRKILRACKFGCGARLGNRDMRLHVIVCPRKVSKPLGRPRKPVEASEA
jgi:hypothetical protein